MRDGPNGPSRGRGRGRGYQGRNFQPDYQTGRGGRGGGYGSGGGRFNNQNQNWNQQGGGGRGGRMGRGYWGNDQRGGGGRGRGRGRGRAVTKFNDPEDIQFLKSLKGHTDSVTCAALDHDLDQLYTGSKDGTVRVWSCSTGECKSTVEVGGAVDCLLLQQGRLYVGLHDPARGPTAPGTIRIWDAATGAEQTLTGPQGTIQTLLVASDMIFSGSNDQATTIHVWKLDAAGQFQPQVALGAAQGGHTFPVQALVVASPFLFSADWKGCLKVWDVTSGACVQTLDRAHDNVIMGLVVWQDNLLSCSLDGTIKIWQAVETPAPGAVLDPAPVYVHPPDTAGQQYGGVLAIAGVADAVGTPVLLATHNDDHVVRLWELPTFAERGELSAVHDARALVAGGPAGLIVTGDKHGTVKVWKWKPPTGA
eukprot:CAMPEP_0206138416 /NCGR_PEP_ID=MMETSP1473-20131121/3309_1 /ASSEMBLY_ACC=CAM_ASM_001109 /TAXON_ID=1461547 /ORGANISM="Stichococcus sp, Strain RCC1054" /LENGTH=420 /DNA_ID=CAMNT_0053531851 /DNA_START=427 /DNA_END=1689 /DNA_ORIENTATION=+